VGRSKPIAVMLRARRLRHAAGFSVMLERSCLGSVPVAGCLEGRNVVELVRSRLSAAGSPGSRPRNALRTFGIKAEVFSRAAPGLGRGSAPPSIQGPQGRQGPSRHRVSATRWSQPSGTCRAEFYTRNIANRRSSWNSTTGTRPAERFGAPLLHLFTAPDLLDALRKAGSIIAPPHLGHRLTGIEERKWTVLSSHSTTALESRPSS